ncbi:MAG TPA: sulfite exporter TauE/SafE family protein [Bryobacteraceae bacterium]|nr:sulfite exporter TauE/SafE family protein [Bryobacteraceae bacterium]
MLYHLAIAAVALLAGGIASLAGFGIGSLLTPLVAAGFGMKTAVGAVSIPHLIATALRFSRLNRELDRGVLLGFGLMNAMGALAGALIHVYVSSRALTTVLAILLIFAGMAGLSGMAKKFRLRGAPAWIAGALSGGFGGLVGNQGGIRSAALLGFELPGLAFVATATAIALAVDAVRMPVYFITGHSAILAAWRAIVAATIGVVIGTLAGERILRRIPETFFRKLVAALLLAIGILLLAIPPRK